MDSQFYDNRQSFPEIDPVTGELRYPGTNQYMNQQTANTSAPYPQQYPYQQNRGGYAPQTYQNTPYSGQVPPVQQSYGVPAASQNYQPAPQTYPSGQRYTAPAPAPAPSVPAYQQGQAPAQAYPSGSYQQTVTGTPYQQTYDAARINAMNEENSRLRLELEELRRLREKEEKDLEENRTAAARARDEADSYRKELDTALQQAEEARRQSEAELAAAKEEAERKQQEVLAQLRMQQAAQNNELQQKMAEARNSMELLWQQSQEERQRIEEERRQLEETKSQVSGMQESFEAEKDRIASEKDRIAAEMNRIAAARQQLDQEKASSEEIRRKLEEERSSLDAAKQKAEQDRNAFEASRQIFDQNLQKFNSDRSALDQSMQRLARERNLFDETVQRFNLNVDEFEKQRAATEQSMAELEQDRAALEQNRAALEQNRAALEEHIQRFNDDRSEFEKQREETERDKVRLAEERLAAEQLRRQLDEDRIALEASKQQSIDELAARERLIAETEKQNQVQRANVDETRMKDAESLRAFFEARREEAENMRLELEKEKAEFELQKQQLMQNAEEELRKIEEERELLRNEQTEFEKKVAEAAASRQPASPDQTSPFSTLFDRTDSQNKVVIENEGNDFTVVPDTMSAPDISPEDSFDFFGFDFPTVISGEPAPEEPAAEQPVVEEPVPAEPVIEQPVVEEPVPAEPVAEQPAVEEPAPAESVIEQPVVEEPVPAEPVIEQPVVEEPAPTEPVIEQPVVEEPAPTEPVIEQPVVEEPAPAEPVAEQPVVGEPAPAEPVAEQPVVEEPAPAESVVEQPAVVETATADAGVEIPVFIEETGTTAASDEEQDAFKAIDSLSDIIGDEPEEEDEDQSFSDLLNQFSTQLDLSDLSGPLDETEDKPFTAFSIIDIDDDLGISDEVSDTVFDDLTKEISSAADLGEFVLEEPAAFVPVGEGPETAPAPETETAAELQPAVDETVPVWTPEPAPVEVPVEEPAPVWTPEPLSVETPAEEPREEEGFVIFDDLPELKTADEHTEEQGITEPAVNTEDDFSFPQVEDFSPVLEARREREGAVSVDTGSFPLTQDTTVEVLLEPEQAEAPGTVTEELTTPETEEPAVAEDTEEPLFFEVRDDIDWEENLRSELGLLQTEPIPEEVSTEPVRIPVEPVVIPTEPEPVPEVKVLPEEKETEPEVPVLPEEDRPGKEETVRVSEPIRNDEEEDIFDFDSAVDGLAEAAVLKDNAWLYSANNLAAVGEEVLKVSDLTSKYYVNEVDCSYPSYKGVTFGFPVGSCTAVISSVPFCSYAFVRAIACPEEIADGTVMLGTRRLTHNDLIYIGSDRLVEKKKQTLDWMMSTIGGNAEQKRAKLVPLLEQVGMTGLAETELDSLTYSQRMLVLLMAVSFSSTPVVLINDPKFEIEEADVNSACGVFKLLADSGKTVMLAGHSPRLMRSVANRILAIHYGNPVFAGSYRSFIDENCNALVLFHSDDAEEIEERLLSDERFEIVRDRDIIEIQRAENSNAGEQDAIDAARAAGIPVEDLRKGDKGFSIAYKEVFKARPRI